MNSLERKKRALIVCSLVIPMVLFIRLVMVPATDLFRVSFTNWDGCSVGYDWIKLDNYIAMLRNKDLWMSPKNNAVYFVGHLLSIPVELAFAVSLASKLQAAKSYETMVFMLYIINGAAIAYAFSYFFSPTNGALDTILSLFHLDGPIRNQLSGTRTVNYVLTSISLWRFSEYHVIPFMAALQSLSQDVQETAEVDGANAWRLFRYTQIPSIMLMVDFVLSDDIRGVFQVFDIPHVMASDGPEYVSLTFTPYTIDTAFKYSNFGSASATAVAIILTIVVIYLTQNKIIRGIVLKGMEK